MAEENKYFQLQVITPDRIFYEGEASMVEFNSVDGEMGVYKHHIPLTTVLAPGIVTITESGGQKEAAIHAGFVQILGEKVTFLAEVAEWPDEIDVARAEAAKARAEERLHNHAADVDVARAEIALQRALVRIGIKQ